MAKKPIDTKGKGKPKGKLTPITGGRKKTIPTLEKLAERIPDLPFPDKLLSAKVTPKSLANANYQKKLLAFMAPFIIPELGSALRRAIRCTDIQAMKLAAEVFGLTPKSNGGVNIMVNQQNNSPGQRGGAADDGAIGSFEDIARIMQERRRSLPVVPSREMMIAPVFEATPED